MSNNFCGQKPKVAIISLSNVDEFEVELSRGRYLGRYLGFCLLFTCHFLISRFVEDVVVVQRRQRNSQKSVTHMHICYFPNQNVPVPVVIG